MRRQDPTTTRDYPCVRPPRAFTLVELLVVIAVVTLLTGLLLPVLGKARSAARRMVCSSNTRQLILATLSYHQGYGVFPQPAEDDDLGARKSDALWFNAVDPYLNLSTADYSVDANRRYVPIKQDPVWSDLPTAAQATNRTLKMNDHFGLVASGDVRFYRAAEIAKPSLTVVYVDGRADDIRADTIAEHFHATEGRVGLRHDDGANVAFADGHGQLVKQAINYSLAAPGWYTEATGLQELVWRFGR